MQQDQNPGPLYFAGAKPLVEKLCELHLGDDPARYRFPSVTVQQLASEEKRLNLMREIAVQEFILQLCQQYQVGPYKPKEDD